MNTNQKKYALNRIDGLFTIKLRETEDKFRIKEELICDSKRIDLIFAGKVKLLPRDKINDYTDLADAYDFSSIEVKGGFKKEFNNVMSKLKKISQDAKDQIMLGDCEEALKLIQKLEIFEI